MVICLAKVSTASANDCTIAKICVTIKTFRRFKRSTQLRQTAQAKTSVSAPKNLRCPAKTRNLSAGKPANWSPAASSKSQSAKYSARRKTTGNFDVVTRARRARARPQPRAQQPSNWIPRPSASNFLFYDSFARSNGTSRGRNFLPLAEPHRPIQRQFRSAEPPTSFKSEIELGKQITITWFDATHIHQ